MKESNDKQVWLQGIPAKNPNIYSDYNVLSNFYYHFELSYKKWRQKTKSLGRYFM